MPLYHSPRGLYEFQAHFAAYGILRQCNLVAADCGLGKTHVALATAAVLIEDDLIDLVLCVVEGNKVDEWMADIAEFTDLTACRYWGTPKKRAKMRATGFPQMVVTTYQTARDDLALRDPADNRKLSPGPLMEALRGRRLFVIYDEMTMLGGATSGMHMAQRMLIDEHRLSHPARLMGLTATPLTNGPVSYYNLGRLLCPEAVGEERAFQREHVTGYSRMGTPNRFRHLDKLAVKMSEVLLRKRKTDPDVIDLFPEPIEKFVEVEMSGPHLHAYNVMDNLVEDLPLASQQFAFNQLRAFACHPGWALHSSSELAELLIAVVGRDVLAKMKSRKSEMVIPYLRQIISQGDSAIVFADSVSVLRCLSADLDAAGIRHGMYHGQVSNAEREKVKGDFKAKTFPVMLASSAAEKGVNLPEASYIVNFDVPLNHYSYVQRLGRGSRIGTNAGGVLIAKTFITDATVEQGAVRLWNRRNRWSDDLIDADVTDDDENFTSARERLALIRAATKKKVLT